MFSFQSDASRGLRMIRRMRAQLPVEGLTRLRIIAGQGMRVLLRRAPRDTNRFVNGWAMAGNAARIGTFSVLALQKSKYRGDQENRILGQLSRFKKLASEQEQSLAMTGSPAQRAAAQRTLAKLQKRLEMAKREAATLYRSPHAIVIGRSSAGAKRGMTRGGRVSLAISATVRGGVFGGTGSSGYIRGGGAYVDLFNMEPHATIVERRTHVRANVTRQLRPFGVGNLRTLMSDLWARAA